MALAVLAALLTLSLVVAVGARRSQLERVETASALVVATQDLRSALGRADAASVNAFLAGGVDQPDQRARYSDALDEAALALQRAGTVAGPEDSAASQAVAGLQRLLPRYAGLVETARADNRQQLPLGAAYLRRASDVLREDVAPQLDALRGAGETSLRDIDDNVTAGLGAVPAVLMVVLLVALLWVQRWLAGRTRRRINPALALGTVVMVIGSLFAAGQFGSSGQAAADGLTNGYDRLAVLSALRTDAYDHQASATFALVDRGARDQFNASADTAALRAEVRLVGATQQLEPTEEFAGTVSELSADWASYLAASEAATAADLAGSGAEARQAVVASVADPDSVAGRFERFDKQLLGHLEQAAAGLDGGLGDARASLAWGELRAVLMALVVAGAAAWGLQRRLAEYR
ncbi:MAG: hypothetical protein ACKV2O_17985 [Acidimicrobiales bacterium]